MNNNNNNTYFPNNRPTSKRPYNNNSNNRYVRPAKTSLNFTDNFVDQPVRNFYIQQKYN